MRYVIATLLTFALAPLTAPLAWAQGAQELKIYVIDVEGGGATLFVPPSGESLLIDTGNQGAAAVRDVDRIMEAVKDAGISRIDHLVTTHYHGDHVGGVVELAKRIPIVHYIDHGANIQMPAVAILPEYEALWAKAKHTVAKPGDKLAMAGLDITVVSSAGQIIAKPLPGAGQPNPYCGNTKPIDPDTSENGQSVGISLGFGRFKVAHLGDLTWNGEVSLMCPNNKFGTADVFMVSHHSQQRPAAMSNSEALVWGLRPRVAISTNGIRKGAQVAAMKILFNSPGLEDLWQLHFSQFSGQEYTAPGMFIANRFDDESSTPVDPLSFQSPGPNDPPIPPHNGKAYYLKITAKQDGSFTVLNTRNNFSKTYAARR